MRYQTTTKACSHCDGKGHRESEELLTDIWAELAPVRQFVVSDDAVGLLLATAIAEAIGCRQEAHLLPASTREFKPEPVVIAGLVKNVELALAIVSSGAEVRGVAVSFMTDSDKHNLPESEKRREGAEDWLGYDYIRGQGRVTVDEEIQKLVPREKLAIEPGQTNTPGSCIRLSARMSAEAMNRWDQTLQAPLVDALIGASDLTDKHVAEYLAEGPRTSLELGNVRIEMSDSDGDDAWRLRISLRLAAEEACREGWEARKKFFREASEAMMLPPVSSSNAPHEMC